MKKSTIYIVMATLCLFFKVNAQNTSITVTGKVADEMGLPISGATIKIESGKFRGVTNDKGIFTLKDVPKGTILIISSLGFETTQIVVNQNSDVGIIKMQMADTKLKEVEIVNTGYQKIPKERATGSFVIIDSTLLNRRVGTNILDRLDGITSGLIFNKNQNGLSNNSDITIRGRSTIFANASPLIVVDNFPYDGDINNINPNDIETVSILKDAAAASIWGARSGNGVIVITTKKGKSSENVKISLNTNYTISERPNLHYQNQMSSSEYIDLEQYLFNKGSYNNIINNGYAAISPAVAIMLQKRNGLISTSDSLRHIEDLKKLDVRNDLEKYIYQPSIKQQYALNLSGGNNTHLYYISAGYDSNLQNISTNTYSRFSLNANNTYKLLNNKFQIYTSILLSSSNTKDNNSTYTSPFTPYDQLVDNFGSHLSVVQTGGLRELYTDTAGHNQLLDWKYRPLDENHSNSSSQLTDYKLNTNFKYTLLSGFNLSLNYQYQKGGSDYTQLNTEESFYTRNLINSITQLNQVSLVATRPIPLGAISNTSNSSYHSNYGRLQIDYAKTFSGNHELNILAGVEVKDYQAVSLTNTMYGFNTSTASSIPVDNITDYSLYTGSGTSRISSGDGQTFSVDRFRSVFFNASYAYSSRYVISASARRDESNIFGVKANQKGVPLWSTGIKWNVSKEAFYNFDPLPILNIRLTYGFNGNLDRTTSAYLTAISDGVNNWNKPVSRIVNPPNPSLRWERVKNTNLSIEFASKRNLISGSIEYFVKDGLDLIANSPIEPQSGITQFRGNSADTKTSGMDIILNKNSIKLTNFKWQSNFLFSYNREKIINYKVKQGSNANIINQNYINPLEGYPYYSIFSYPYRGLNSAGKPIGFLNGQTSQDYTAISRSSDVSNLVYNGSAVPTIYGSFRNSLFYNGFDLSVNLTYKLNYFFRRNNVFAGSTYNYQSSDFNKRWQVPGDELLTDIPALVYPTNSAQNSFYQGSEILVEKGDHVRLQDIKFSYHFKNSKSKLILKNLQLYTYINNVGIIWKATKQDIDPDYVSSQFVNPKSIAFGLSANF